jgi:hypothetical protein
MQIIFAGKSEGGDELISKTRASRGGHKVLGVEGVGTIHLAEEGMQCLGVVNGIIDEKLSYPVTGLGG